MQNRCAVITGASRGIGKAIAIALSGRGFSVVINYNNSAVQAQETVDLIEKNNGSAFAFAADVSSFSQAGGLIEAACSRYGSVHALVNCAGITRDGLLMRMSEQDFDKVIEVNLKSAFNCVRHAVPIMMKQRWGRIVNISSVSGVMGNAGQVNYSASKAGLLGMTKAIAREVGSRGITCNAVAPGYIDTDMTAPLNSEVKEKLLQGVALRRMGQPEEVAALAAFLCEENAGYITGQTICIDGGMAM